MATETWVLNDEINEYTGATTGEFARGLNYLAAEFETNEYNVKSLIFDSRGSYTSTGGWGIGIQSNAVPTSASATHWMYENGGGWTSTAFKTWVFSTAPTGDLLTWLTANGTKKVTPRLSVDVSTLAGWANLSAGAHSITIVAKAAGYKDSAPSAAVEVTKAASTKTLKAGTYQFVKNLQVPQKNISEQFACKGYYLTAQNTYGNLSSIDSIISAGSVFEMDFADENHNMYDSEIQQWYTESTDGNTYNATDTSKLRTIILESDQQVSVDFYEWAITGGNLVTRPCKGDVITIENKQYRVLDRDGKYAKLLSLSDSYATQMQEAGGDNAVYEDSYIDEYCTTFYNGLSSSMKTAILQTNIQQKKWYIGDTGSVKYIAKESMDYNTGEILDTPYYISTNNEVSGNVLMREVYILSIQDILDYVGVTPDNTAANTPLTVANIGALFNNVKNAKWLLDVQPSTVNFPIVLNLFNIFYAANATGTCYALPCFVIDLSKISWS